LVADEVRPLGGYYLAELIRLISDRYGFSQTPSVENTKTMGAIFKDGRLVYGNRKINIQEIGFLKDGLYVTAQDTTTADFVVDDLITWAEQAIGLRRSITNVPRKYDNAVVVEFEADIEKRLGVFNDVIRLFNEVLSSMHNRPISTSFYRIDFAFDTTEVNLAINNRFTIERRLGSPFSSNRYHCIAPIKTETHIEMLEKFEMAID
jgi:hypothetical protein